MRKRLKKGGKERLHEGKSCWKKGGKGEKGVKREK